MVGLALCWGMATYRLGVAAEDAGYWACADLTLVSSEWSSSLGRNVTVHGALWAGGEGRAATGAQQKWPMYGARRALRQAPGLPFVTLQQWAPDQGALATLGFRAVVAGQDEELPLMDSTVAPPVDVWRACTDGEQFYTDLEWDEAFDGVRRQVVCGAAGWKVRLEFQFARGPQDGPNPCSTTPALPVAAT